MAPKRPEFAPGIPSGKPINPLPTVKPTTLNRWMLAVQNHDAVRAGNHWDIRLVDPDAGKAHSWAIPKARLPAPGEKLLAIQTFTHTPEYALHFGDQKPAVIPQGYGKGRVQMVLKSPVDIVKATPDKIHFNLYEGKKNQEFILRRTNDKTWLLHNVTLTRENRPDIPQSKPAYKTIEPGKIDVTDASQLMSAKVDGAHNTFVLEANQPVRVFSHRPTERDTGLIEHSPRFLPGFLAKVPKSLDGLTLRGELFAADPHTGRARDAATTGGILNSSVWKSRDAQQHSPLRAVIFDVVQKGQQNAEALPYEKKLDLLKRVNRHLPFLELPPMARAPKEKINLLNRIRTGREPITSEGVVLWPREGGAPMKAKFRPDHDVYVRSIFPETGAREGLAGGFTYSWTPRGKIVGSVGTGLDHALKQDMLAHPERYQGRVARVKALGVFTDKENPKNPGALRAPSFQDWHLDKGMQPMEEKTSNEHIKTRFVKYARSRSAARHLSQTPPPASPLEQILALSKQAAENAVKKYRERVEVFGVTPKGKILGGLYDDGTFGTFGGGIDLGESPLQAARREYFEESGRTLKNVQPLPIQPLVQPWLKHDVSAKQKARIKEFPGGSRTHFLMGELTSSKKPRPAGTDIATHLLDIKLRPIQDIIQLQKTKMPEMEKAVANRMQKRIEALQHVQNTIKTSATYPTQKLAMGQRQMKRVLNAVVRRGSRNLPLRADLLRSGEELSDLAWYARPKEAIPSHVQDILAKQFNPLTYQHTAEMGLPQTQQHIARALRKPTASRFINDMFRAYPKSNAEMLSAYQEDLRRIKDITAGKRVVNIKPSTEFTPENIHEALPSPSHVGWRGGPSSQYTASTPTWYSGIPNVSADYASNAETLAFSPSTSRLRAYDLKNVPEHLQTPWTKHIAIDPWQNRKTWEDAVASNIGQTERSVLGNLPNYEKVLKAGANPPLLAEYKPLTQNSDIFVQTRGKPLLKTSALYHGSPLKLPQLDLRDDHGDPRVKPAVFASPNKTFALAYTGKKWGDRDINQTMQREKTSGYTALKQRLVKQGYHIDVHKAITNQALDNIQRRGLFQFTPEQRERLNAANAATDITNVKSLFMSKRSQPFHYHVGEEALAEKLIANHLAQAQREQEADAALDALGIALHTKQDRWSHYQHGVKNGLIPIIRHQLIKADDPYKYPQDTQRAIQDTEELLTSFMQGRQAPLGHVTQGPQRFVAKMQNPIS